jgi:protein CpxP
MKRLILIALLAIGVNAVSFAQGPMSPEEQIAALKSSLTLTDAQVAKVTTIYQARTKSIDSLRTATPDGDRQAMFAKILPIFNTANAKVKAILTPEQAVIFQKQVDLQNERFKQFQQGQN